MVVLPAPDGPTRATSWPGSAVKVTSNSTCWDDGGVEHGHRLQRGQGDLLGGRVAEVDVVELDRAGPGGPATASGSSWIIGGRSSTSKTRSKETRVVITSICTLDRAVSGP